MFYAGVFPFLKFATKLMIFKYGVDANMAGLIPAMLPFVPIFLTPLFGSVYDKYGKGATLMIIRQLPPYSGTRSLCPATQLMGACHRDDAHPGHCLRIGAFCHVAIRAKDHPNETLGTAYALIFYIQNIGLALIPVWIGKVNQANTGADGVIDYTETMTIFAAFGVIAIVISFLLLLEDKRKGYGLQQPNVKINEVKSEERRVKNSFAFRSSESSESIIL